MCRQEKDSSKDLKENRYIFMVWKKNEIIFRLFFSLTRFYIYLFIY